jgi:tetratricopeptide (TPR) repeat protein
MSTPEGSRGKGRWLLVAALLAAVAGGGYLAWRWWLKPPPPDMVAVLQANTRGAGYMDQYEYDKAVEAFEEVVKRAPDWLPGKINLGIALMNTGQDPAHPNLKRATKLFEQVLKEDPRNPYAHFCLGIIIRYQKAGDATAHFEAVTKIDPGDAAAWFNLGLLLHEDEARQFECFSKAVERDPYLTGALQNLQLKLRLRGEDKKADEMLKKMEALRATEIWFTRNNLKYNDMGRYAQVIGGPAVAQRGRVGPVPLFRPHDRLQVKLAPGARWATAADLGDGPLGELRRAVRARFGATVVVLDYNGDGKPDLFLLGAVVEAGQVRDLLLRNDGGGVFTDVTAEAGLGGARPSLGCSVADFDNNGRPDLLITGAGRVWLFRNGGSAGKDAGRFEDVSAEAGLDKVTAVCLGATFVDLDQDGDLDLVIARYADTVEQALALLKGTGTRGPGLAVYLNVGEVPAADPNVDPPPLKPRFRLARAAEAKGLAAVAGGPVPAVAVVASDLDHDADLDLLVLADRAAPALVLNDRLLTFRRTPLPRSLLAPADKGDALPAWNGGLVLDANRDQRSDLLLLPAGQKPILLLNRHVAGQEDVGKWFEPAPVHSPPLLQAQAIDLDLDGWTDVVGLSSERVPVLLQNEKGRLVRRAGPLGGEGVWPKDLVAVVVEDFDGDGLPDVLGWSEKEGLRLLINQGNGNQGVWLTLSGHRKTSGQNLLRCNADGIGTWVTAQSADHGTGAEYTTLSAGLGQSTRRLLLGMGPHRQAQVVRLRWPDQCVQAEFDAPAGQTTRIEELDRKPGSCPVLFAWDGRRFGFVTDFLGAGAMGEALPGGGHRPPRPEESVKIEADQLVPRGGEYVLKIAEPGNEVTYLDRLLLLAVDHPADVRVYPDERFTSGPPPSQDLLIFRDEIFPERARDHRGRDVTETLRRWDRDTVDGFARRSWTGLAEEHGVELDFGGRLARFGPEDRLVLCLAAWTDYAYPESIWAADQAGVAIQAPVLERLGEDGKWHPVAADAGFPAGLPRMMTLELTGKLTGPRCVLRLRTNLQVYWDQIFVAPLRERVPSPTRPGPVAGKEGPASVRVTGLPVSRATLAARGCVQEFSPDGRQPSLYDHDRIERIPVSRLAGRLTRLGDVTELLTARDDCFVIFGPGEEVTAAFDARGLPPLPPGWKRSFVLRAWGYSKSAGPFVATGDTVEPLPFAGMSAFPYGPAEHYPRTPRHEDYRRRFNTRRVGGGR